MATGSFHSPAKIGLRAFCAALTIQDVNSARLIMERGGRLKEDENEKIKREIAGFEESPDLGKVFDAGELKPLMEKAAAKQDL